MVIWHDFTGILQLYLVQRVALVIVLFRQTVARISADEWAARVCVAHGVNVGGWRSVRRSCKNKQTNKGFILIKRRKKSCFFPIIFPASSFHSQVPEMTPKTSLCKLVSRKVLDLGGVIKALVRSESSLPFWGKTAQQVNLIQSHVTRGCTYLWKATRRVGAAGLIRGP